MSKSLPIESVKIDKKHNQYWANTATLVLPAFVKFIHTARESLEYPFNEYLIDCETARVMELKPFSTFFYIVIPRLTGNVEFCFTQNVTSENSQYINSLVNKAMSLLTLLDKLYFEYLTIRKGTTAFETNEDYEIYLNGFEDAVANFPDIVGTEVTRKLLESMRLNYRGVGNECKHPLTVLKQSIVTVLEQSGYVFSTDSQNTPPAIVRPAKNHRVDKGSTRIQKHLNTLLANVHVRLIQQSDYFIANFLKDGSSISHEHFAIFENLALIDPEFNYLFKNYLNNELHPEIKLMVVLSIVKTTQHFSTTVRDIIYMIEHREKLLNSKSQNHPPYQRSELLQDSEGGKFLWIACKLLQDITLWQQGGEKDVKEMSVVLQRTICWWVENYLNK